MQVCISDHPSGVHLPAVAQSLCQQGCQALQSKLQSPHAKAVMSDSVCFCVMLQFTDIQGTLEAVPSSQSIGTSDGQARGSPAMLSPEASGGHLQGEASQGSLAAALGDEQKKKPRREWQQSLRNSNKFKSADAARGPWGLSSHSPKTERRSVWPLHRKASRRALLSAANSCCVQVLLD